MNSYSLDLLYSWWLIPIIILFCFGFSFFIYRNTLPPLPQLKKWILITLRSIGIFLLIFILLEPVFLRIFGEFIKPKIFLALDNSTSAAARDAKFNRKDLFKSALSNSDIMKYDSKDYEDPNSRGYKGKGNLFILKRKLASLTGTYFIRILTEDGVRLAQSLTPHSFTSSFDKINPADLMNRYSCNACHSKNPLGGATGGIYAQTNVNRCQ